MKLFFYLVISIIVSVSIVYSRPLPIDKYNRIDNTKCEIAYQIVIPPKVDAEGQIIAGTLYNITKVPSEYYVHNAVHIKTTKLQGELGKPIRLSNKIISTLGMHNITAIKAPFQNYFREDKLKRNAILSQSVDNISRIYEVTYNDGIDPYELCQELMKNPEIEYAVPIFIRKSFSYQPNDPGMGNQWHLNRINLPMAWDLSKGDSSVVIGIVDSGVEIDHEDLAANIWTNPIDSTYNGIDEDKNGKIDDVHGWDFGNNDNDPRNPGDGHGTHVSGCTSAVTDNGIGIASPGFKCKILPCKVEADNTSGIIGYPGIVYAASKGVKVINCSWGGPGSSPAEQEIIDVATASGSLVVVAAGNDNLTDIDDIPTYPASYKNVLCVGASTLSNGNDALSPASNIGVSVSVYAPGVQIYSTYLSNQYAALSGTSMASPIVAGVAALVFSIHKGWTPKQVAHQIRSTSANVFTSDTNTRKYIYGRLDAYAALDYNHTPGKTMPGIEAIYNLDNVDYLYDNQPRPFNLKLTNYLGKADDLTLSIVPEGNYLTFSKNIVEVGSMDSMESKDIQLEITLNENNPWYYGYAKLLLVYKSGSYTDYQLIKIPIQVPSNNKFTVLGQFPYPAYTPQWYSAASNSDVFWMAGYGGVLGNNSGWYRFTSAGKLTNRTLGADQVFAVGMINGDKVSMGTGSTTGGTAAYIYNTTDAGASWSKISVSPITSFVDDIHYYDDNNGIFIGDPKGSNWGIGITADAGVTWSRISGVPAPKTNEAGLNSVSFWEGDHIWFGTNQGRIFHSPDRGSSWDVTTLNRSTYVIGICFKGSENGLVIYRDTAQGSPYLLARTSNGGQNWETNAHNFTQYQYTPINLFSVPQSNLIYVLCSRGEIFGTSDLGRNWIPVQTAASGMISKGALSVLSNKKLRMWEGGNVFGYLDFDYNAVSDVRENNTVQIEDINGIFPNPAMDFIEINFELINLRVNPLIYGFSDDIRICNSLGEIVMTVGARHALPLRIDVSGLATGVYFIRFGDKVSKFIKI